MVEVKLTDGSVHKFEIDTNITCSSKFVCFDDKKEQAYFNKTMISRIVIPAGAKATETNQAVSIEIKEFGTEMFGNVSLVDMDETDGFVKILCSQEKDQMLYFIWINMDKVVSVYNVTF